MIEQEQVNVVIEALERAKEQPPVKSYASQKDAVEAMRDHIADLHKRGWSIAAIAKIITDAGIKTSPAVVSSVLNPPTRRRRKKVSPPQSEPLST